MSFSAGQALAYQMQAERNKESKKQTLNKIYVASSWRNDIQPGVVSALRQAHFDVYDFKNPAPGTKGFHWSEIDPDWKLWTPGDFRDVLQNNGVVDGGFRKDMANLKTADICVLVMPCGRSAHLEAGWAIGAGKPTAILLSDGEPELMYKMAAEICLSLHELLVWCDYIRHRENIAADEGGSLRQGL